MHFQTLSNLCYQNSHRGRCVTLWLDIHHPLAKIPWNPQNIYSMSLHISLHLLFPHTRLSISEGVLQPSLCWGHRRRRGIRILPDLR